MKRGFYKEKAAGPYNESPMTYEQLVRLAGNWNKEGKRDTSIKEVAVLDVLDQTAVAKVTASVGHRLHAAGAVRRPLEDHADPVAEPSAEGEIGRRPT